MKKVGNFRNDTLYLTQNNATRVTELVEKSFAYIASDEKSEKDSFLAWAEKLDLADGEARTLKNKEFITNEKERKNI